MERLKELISKAKCGVYIEVNKHKDYYESVYTHITPEKQDDIPSDILDKMIELDTCVRLQVYPNSPIGFFVIYHYDLEKAIDIALNEL